jgi:hypothetical protein
VIPPSKLSEKASPKLAATTGTKIITSAILKLIDAAIVPELKGTLERATL